MTDRGGMIGWIVGVIGVGIAVVALIIALNAKSGNQSDAELADSVKGQVNRQLGALGLKQGAAAKHARQAERNLSAGERRQARANRRAQGQLKGSEAATQSDIAGINRRLNTIGNDVRRLTNEQRVVQSDIRNLDNRVGRLERQRNSGK